VPHAGSGVGTPADPGAGSPAGQEAASTPAAQPGSPGGSGTGSPGGLDDIIAWQEEIFAARQPESRRLASRAGLALAGGVTSSWQTTRPQPVWVSHGQGSKVYDVDGNERRMTRASQIESETVEWGVMDDDGRVTKCPAEHDARDYQAAHGGELVYRVTIQHTRRLGVRRSLCLS
jgi:hypothetical protein